MNLYDRLMVNSSLSDTMVDKASAQVGGSNDAIIVLSLGSVSILFLKDLCSVNFLDTSFSQTQRDSFVG